MKINKEVKSLIDELVATGRFTLFIGNGAHNIGVRHISGRRFCLPSTPSDWRSVKNSRSMAYRIDMLYSNAA